MERGFDAPECLHAGFGALAALVSRLVPLQAQGSLDGRAQETVGFTIRGHGAEINRDAAGGQCRGLPHSRIARRWFAGTESTAADWRREWIVSFALRRPG